MGGFLPTAPKVPVPPRPEGTVTRERTPQGGPVWRRQQQDRLRRRGPQAPQQPPGQQGRLPRQPPPQFPGEGPGGISGRGIPGAPPQRGLPLPQFPGPRDDWGAPRNFPQGPGMPPPTSGPGEIIDNWGPQAPPMSTPEALPNAGMAPISKPPLMGGIPRGGIMGGVGMRPRPGDLGRAGTENIFGSPFGGFGG